MDRLVRQYLDAALWAETGDDAEPLDDTYTSDDFTEKSKELAQEEVFRFLDTFAEKMNASIYDYGLDDEQVVVDFWLTRNHHGAGFWDGDYPDEISGVLTDMAHAFGQMYVIEDGEGQVYFSRG